MALIIGLLIPLLGTMLGAAFVFFMRDDMSPRLQKALLGFASGVMVAASVWSLLIPSMEMEADKGIWSVVPAALADDSRVALHAGLCRRCHALRRGGRAYPRSQRRQALEPEHHRLCHRFRSHDGT